MNGNEEKTTPPSYWRWAFGAAVLLVIILIAAVLFGRPGKTSVQIARAARVNLVVPILSDGTLEPLPGGELRAPEAATVAAILAHEGEHVRKGKPLVQLENAELTSKALEARSEVSQLLVERARAAAELESERREAARLQKIVEADRRLFAEGAITRVTSESDELAFRRATERVHLAEAQLQSLSHGGKGNAADPSRLDLAEASAREFERQVLSLTVRAPADGVAYGLPRKVGEAVQAGEIIAAIADPEHLRVRVRVDQPDLPRVRVGQRLVVTFDGLPDRKWEGKVTLVSPGTREVGGREVAEVLGQIADPTSALPPNGSVNVQIVAAEKKSALVIPRAALHRDGERRFVYLFQGGRAHRRDVSVGLIGLTDVEITRGLAEGDIVILPGMTPLSDGLRVVAKEG